MRLVLYEKLSESFLYAKSFGEHTIIQVVRSTQQSHAAIVPTAQKKNSVGKKIGLTQTYTHFRMH
jgi:hypothetical protein